MIKVGQIYKRKCEFAKDTIILCITGQRHNGLNYVINNNGIPYFRYDSEFNNYDLIAEYPTWQEAVNSPEFRGE